MLVTHLRPGHRLPNPDKSEAVQLKSLQGLLLKWLFPPTLVAELWPSSWILAWAVQKANPVLKPVFSRRKRELRVLITRGQNWMNENSALLAAFSRHFNTAACGTQPSRDGRIMTCGWRVSLFVSMGTEWAGWWWKLFGPS